MNESTVPDKFEEVICKRLIITDDKGVTKTVLSTDGKKNPSLTMTGESGTVIVDFRKSGIRIGITDKAGNVKARLVVEDSEGQLKLVDKNGKTRTHQHSS